MLEMETVTSEDTEPMKGTDRDMGGHSPWEQEEGPTANRIRVLGVGVGDSVLEKS